MAIVTLGVRGAAATVGGPELAQVLGWDAAAKRLYVQIVDTGAGEQTPAVWYFEIASLRAAEPKFVAWSGGEEDPLYHARFLDLTRKLVPLKLEEPVEAMLSREREPAAIHDSVDSDNGRRPRWLASVGVGTSASDHVRVLTLDPGPHALWRLRRYTVPGSAAKLEILSCESLPEEGGYEVQFPVLTGAGAGTADPIDPWTFCVHR
jgi:hypothetical protein